MILQRASQTLHTAFERLVNFLFSIRFRLVLWFALILGMVLVGFSAFIYVRQLRETESAIYSRLRLKLERLVGGPRSPDHDAFTGSFPGFANASDPWNAWFQEGDILAIMLPDGSIQNSWGSLQTADIVQLPVTPPGWTGGKEIEVNSSLLSLTAETPGETRYMFISVPVTQNNVISGYILLGTPFDPNNQLSQLLGSLILGSSLTLIVALVGGFWLADRAMHPVYTITQTARKITETDLSMRLDMRGRDELASLAGTFDEMIARLQAAFERQRQFTADASHEMRTPLTIIDLEASRALSARRSAGEYERVLKVIHSENKFMGRLVNNLLALARMDAGQVALLKEDVDLGDLTLDVIERLTPLAAKKGVDLACGELPELVVAGDRQYLLQMLTNLVENAIKYSRRQAGRVTVGLAALEQGGGRWASLSVADNGPGIAAEHLEHIFDRFYRVDDVRSQNDAEPPADEETSSSGTGLGLAITQWIVKAHGGLLHVSSEVGVGSTFEVRLPLPA